MSSSPMGDPDENTPLVGSRASQEEEAHTMIPYEKEASASPRAAKGMTTWTRVSLLGLLALLTGASVYFQMSLLNLQSELRSDEAQIGKLETTVNLQKNVIGRFNTSVTNSDVIERVMSLTKELNSTEKRMNERLDKTQVSINSQLQETLNTLDSTVNSAQSQIEMEVTKVKADVDVYVRTTQDQFSMENSFMIYQLAGTFTLLGGLISMWHMTAHLRRFNQPFVQRKILAILWMCPIYSITSWLSLVFTSAGDYLEILKDFYEAYVIYQFLSFLIAVLGRGNRQKVVEVLARHSEHLSPPARLCGCFCPKKYDSPQHLADAVLMECQMLAMQFVLLRPLTSISMFTLNRLDYFGGGTSKGDYRSPQFWLTIIQNLSVFGAFTGLLKFYHAVMDDLEWCKPWPKFLCIKGVVFMTFWQGLVLSILASTTDVLEGADTNGESDEWAKQAQDFLICLEMLLFSIAHFYVFPTDEWEDGYRPSHEKKTRFGDNIALGDFFADLKLIVSHKSAEKEKESSKHDGVEGKVGKKARSEEVDVETGVSGDEKDDGSEDDEHYLDAHGDKDEENDELDLMGLQATIAQSLDEDAPPEIRAASQRLLSSRVLQDALENQAAQLLIGELSFQEESVLVTDSFEDDDALVHQQDSVDREEEEEEEEDEYAGLGYMGGDANIQSQGSFSCQETTGLLGEGGLEDHNYDLSTSNDDMLRPSIFTNLGNAGTKKKSS